MNALTEQLTRLAAKLEAAHQSNPPHWAWYYINIALAISVCVIAVALLRDDPTRFQVVSAVLLLIVFGGSLVLMLVGWLAGWGR